MALTGSSDTARAATPADDLTRSGEQVDRDVPVETGAPVSADAVLVEDDLLVEDVSIDGMCGVY